MTYQDKVNTLFRRCCCTPTNYEPKTLVEGHCLTTQVLHVIKSNRMKCLEDVFFDQVIQLYPHVVMKVTHGCKMSLIVVDGKTVVIDERVTPTILCQEAGESHYQPFMFFEEYLPHPIEYRIICFHGRFTWIANLNTLMLIDIATS